MKLWFYFILLISAQNYCFASPIKCEGNFAEGKVIEILSLDTLKEDKATVGLFDSHTHYLTPTQLSCNVNRTNGNMTTSLKWGQGEIQYNSYDPMFSFISFSSHDEDKTLIKDQQIFIYTQSASETHYQKLATTTISQREAVSRFFMLRYTHPFKTIEPQNILVFWSDPSSPTKDSTMSVLGFKYTYVQNSAK